jgi:hypothetical protein
MVDYVKDIVMAWDKASDGIGLDGFKIKYRTSSREPTAAPSNLFTVDEIQQSCQKSRKQPSTM